MQRDERLNAVPMVASLADYVPEAAIILKEKTAEVNND
jgi:hypothetical protein